LLAVTKVATFRVVLNWNQPRVQATSLTRLWQQQGKRAEAHKLLSDIYNWFTEGFDTKDLQEAKELIESLESQRV
jgi:predicted ATPase